MYNITSAAGWLDELGLVPSIRLSDRFRTSADDIVRADVAAAIGRQPYAHHVRWLGAAAFRLAEAPEVVITVPACNEEERLPCCLFAIDAAVRATAPTACAVVVVVNNSDDGSAEVARAWAASASVPAILCVVALDAEAANAAHARRIAMDVGEAVGRSDAVILSTDADTEVCIDWVAALVARIRAGETLVTGAIEVDTAELATLPARVERVGEVERDLLDVLGAIWSRLIPDEPCPFTVTASGASMGLSAAAYRAVGHLPLDGLNEDRALATAILAAGGTVAVEPRGRAVTSCRLDGRAANGMSEALRERCTLADPPIDARAIAVPLFTLAALAFRALAPSAIECRQAALPSGIADRLGAAAQQIAGSGGASRFATVDHLVSRLRTRLTLSQAEAEVVRGRRLLAALDRLGPLRAAATDRVLAALDGIDG